MRLHFSPYIFIFLDSVFWTALVLLSIISLINLLVRVQHDTETNRNRKFTVPICFFVSICSSTSTFRSTVMIPRLAFYLRSIWSINRFLHFYYLLCIYTYLILATVVKYKIIFYILDTTVLFRYKYDKLDTKLPI